MHKVLVRCAIAVCALALLSLAAPAGAVTSVPCTTPSDLCTGDPCTTIPATVATNCVLDFGARALVIAGPITVPDGGHLSLSAASIDVRGPISAIGNTGAMIELHATGNITQLGSVRTVGNSTPGSVWFDAGGAITLAGNVAAPAGSGASATGGTVFLSAAGNVGCPHGCRMDVRGRSNTAAGHLEVHAGGDMYFPVGTHLDGGGGVGGSFVFVANGNFYSAIDNRIHSNGAGATYQVAAHGSITQPRDITVDGSHGGSITLHAGTTIDFSGMLRATSNSGAGGTIDVQGATVTLAAQPSVLGRTAGGRMHFQATGANGVSINANAEARPSGTIQVDAPNGPAVLAGKWRAGPAGCIGVNAATVNATNANFDVARVTSCP